MHRAFLLLIIGVASCRDQAAGRASSAIPATLSRSGAPAAAATPAGAQEGAMWQDPSCEMDTTHGHPDPEQLIREFVARNDSLGFSAGGGEANDQWLDGAAECPGHAVGTDGAAVVRTYRIDSIAVGRDSARYVVRYQVVGATTPERDHMRFVPEARSVQDTVLLIRTPYGWRITGSEAGDPFMSPTAVIRQANLDTASIARLDSATRAGAQRLRPAPNDR